jgi:transglutaminase-like putative cysteine protease
VIKVAMSMRGDHRSTLERFVDEVSVGTDDRARRVALFLAVRDLPYATDGASDAGGLVARGRGNCLAKADLLRHGFRRIGVHVRTVKWRYNLPPNPPEVATLPSRFDIHTAVEIAVDGAWVLVDATNDPPLARGGLTVADWDGIRSTAPNYEPAGPIWRGGEDDAEIDAALAEIAAWYEADPHGADRYLPAFNEWLRSLRRENGGG